MSDWALKKAAEGCPIGCPIEDGRFFPKVVFGHGPGACWTWMARRSEEGYGTIKVGRRTSYAHRVVYEYFVKPVPDGLHVDHLCRNRACVNPNHMETVTCKVNILRGISPSAMQARQTACRRGHPFNEENTYYTPSGRRNCRACARERDRRRAAAIREEKP